MSLGIEYFRDQTHITDLQKLKDEELYFIIGLFRDELENFNKSEEFKLKGLIIVCNEMKDLIKDFRFILNGYIEALDNNNVLRPIEDTEQILKEMDIINNLPDYSIEDIEELLTEMDKIENILDKIKTVRLLKEKVNELADKCLYKMRILYDSLSDFIFDEFHFWENSNLKKRIL